MCSKDDKAVCLQYHYSALQTVYRQFTTAAANKGSGHVCDIGETSEKEDLIEHCEI